MTTADVHLPRTTLTFDVHDDVPEPEGGIVDDGLGEANAAAAPLSEVRGLSCFARLPSGAVIGGAVGRTWGDCCELQQLWVDPVHRKRGVGARLVRLFEERAAARGCSTFFLETFSFQAPSFYESLGYAPATEFRGFPHGIVKYVMVRHAVPTDGRPDPARGPRQRRGRG
jgi:GNAT superfamily N-acetyltransferase